MTMILMNQYLFILEGNLFERNFFQSLNLLYTRSSEAAPKKVKKEKEKAKKDKEAEKDKEDKKVNNLENVKPKDAEQKKETPSEAPSERTEAAVKTEPKEKTDS